MKLIVAGGRDFTNTQLCHKSIVDFMKIYGIELSELELVSGMAKGADTCAIELSNKYKIPLAEFPANWDKHGKGAGYVRNSYMRDYADCLLAFWDFKSKGTKNMIDIMIKAGKPVHVIKY